MMLRQPATNTHQGFTLFELLVAISIFSLISIIAYSGLSAVLNTREQTEKASARLGDIQLTFLNLQRDIQHVVLRPVRDEFGTDKEAFLGTTIGEYTLELSRSGRRNPARVQRSAIQRVAYQLEEETLYRVTWPVLDRPQGIEPKRRKLLDHVKRIEIQYLDDQDEWQTEWPVAATSSATLPGAVNIELELEDYDKINRIFILPKV